MLHRLLAGTAAALATCAMVAGAAQASELPVVYNGALGLAQSSPTASPPGANNWACKPSRAHPRPVILVHGNLRGHVRQLAGTVAAAVNHGYCVFALNYGSYEGERQSGIYGTGDIAQSAGPAGRLRHGRSSGASGRPQGGCSWATRKGGMMPRYYLRFLGGARQGARALVGLSPSNHGNDPRRAVHTGEPAWSPILLRFKCPACEQQDVGSAFLTKLNAGKDTVAGVHTTVIQTANDEVVTPTRRPSCPGRT